ncbi:diguanylate cyclase [Spirochaetota bacterium]
MDNTKGLTNTELQSCMELGKILTSELDHQKLFEIIVNKISGLIPAQNWSLLLMDSKTEKLYFKICVGIDIENVKDIRLSPGEGVAGQVALTQKSMTVNDVARCEYFTDKIDTISGYKTQSILCVPLIFHGKTVGVLEAINPTSLNERSKNLLTYIADYAAIAVENTRRYNHIHEQTILDNLTGLYNTRYLFRNLSEKINASKIDEAIFSLIFMDLDDFKKVVDKYGHLLGSQAIQEVAGTIKKSLKTPEYGVSYGGDEFVIVLPHYDKAKAIEKAEMIRESMKNTAYLSNNGYKINLCASFGVASFPDDGKEMTELINRADKNMFKTKDCGKDAVCGE